MKYLVFILSSIIVGLVIVMGIYDYSYDKELNNYKNRITSMETKYIALREEKVFNYLESYLNMEINDIKELFYNDDYAGYTYYLGSEKQIAIFDNNYNLIALNPQNIEEYNK